MGYRCCVLCVLGALLLTEWVSGSAESSVPEVRITAKSDGNTYTVSNGTTFTVRLQAALGTGYSWSVGKWNSRLVNTSGKYTIEGRALPGGKETQVFKLVAMKSGTSKVWLYYKRFGRGGVKASMSFTVRAK